MSRQRLDDILAALEKEGWRRLGEAEYPDASRDPYALEDNGIVWAVARGARTVVLYFQAFHDLGELTYDLNDISVCMVNETGEDFFFRKRSDVDWHPSVKQFVQRLDGRTKKPD